MSTKYLDHLAHQLKVDKSLLVARAINRMLAEMKKRCEHGEYSNQTKAEISFEAQLRIDDLVP
jgi:hypothetical protein